MFFLTCICKADKDPYLQSNNEEQEKKNYGKISSKVIQEEKRTRQKYLDITIPWHHMTGKKSALVNIDS